MLAPTIVAHTIGPLAAKVTFFAAEINVPVTGLLVLAIFANWFPIAITSLLIKDTP